MKTKILPLLIIFTLLVTSCSKNNSDEAEKSQDTPTSELSDDWNSKYEKLQPSDLSDNVIKLIGKGWMLVTAGKKESYNTMTASWGGIGYIWERPSSFIFIRESRYTYQFLQQEESYTLSFFSDDYKNALKICGTRSGRDTDKVKEAGLTFLETPSGLISFEEARMIIECKKMLVQPLDYSNLTEAYKTKIMEETYNDEPVKHQQFISEIINIWVKNK